MVSSPSHRTKVFISYSHKDMKYLEGLLPHLQYLERNRLIDLWADIKINPGEKWQDAIASALGSTKVAILLVSIDFLNSQYIIENELPELLTAAEKEGVTIVYVILRPCTLPKSLAQFQAINSPAKPLSSMKGYQRESIWVKVADATTKALDAHVYETSPSRTYEVPLSREAVYLALSAGYASQRERETAQSILQGKIATSDFDVFLCHHRIDKPVVKQIGERLKERGLLPWLDEWELRPGRPWQQLLEVQIEHISAAAVFVGKEGMGPWQNQELDAFLREFVRRGSPMIPVLLPDAPEKPTLPAFLSAMTWVDFRVRDPDPLEHLIWGITGKRR